MRSDAFGVQAETSNITALTRSQRLTLATQESVTRESATQESATRESATPKTF